MNKFMYTLYLHNEQEFVQSVLSGLDWAGLTSDPLSRTGLDQDHRLTDLGWTGLFQMNPFHTLLATLRYELSRGFLGEMKGCFKLMSIGVDYECVSGMYVDCGCLDGVHGNKLKNGHLEISNFQNFHNIDF